MVRRAQPATWLVLLVAGCGAPPAVGPEDAGSDGGVDSAVGRPPWLPSLVRACGEWDAVPSDPSTYDTRPELARAIAEASCRYALRCHSALDAATCDPVRLHDAIYDVDVDVERARACLSAWDASTCARADLDEVIRTCLPLQWGLNAPGASCTDAGGCVGVCSNPTFGVCTGTCVDDRVALCTDGCPPGQACANGCHDAAAVGEPCPAGTPCIEGAHCAGGTCVAFPGDGEACLVVSGPITAVFCGPGLACDVDRLCRPIHAVTEGSPCGGASVCAPGLVCAVGTCRVLGAAAGASCPLLPEGADAHVCAPSLYCRPSPTGGGEGTCRPTLPTGAACDAADACASLSDRCLPTDESGLTTVCAQYAGPGCGCDEARICTPGFECHEGQCMRRGTFPHPCTADEDCWRYEGVCGPSGTCEPALIGSPCAPGHVCFEGWCSSRTTTGTCMAERESGEHCVADEQCAMPGTCNGGVCSSGAARCP